MSSHVQRAPVFDARGRHPRRTVLVALGVALLGAIVILVVHLVRAGATAEGDVEPAEDVPRRVGGAIELSAAARERAQIETTVATRSALTPEMHVVGAIAFDPTRVAAVGTRAPGIVTKVLHVEGDSVEKGALLAVIESAQVTDAQADLRVAAAKKKAALANERRERGLLERGLTTAREHEQALSSLEQQQALAESARERVETLGGGAKAGISELRAPVAGVVAERSIAPGQNVGSSIIAFRVGSLERLWVVLRVFERHIAFVRQGDDVDVRLVADGRRSVRGKVAHVGAVLDPDTRTTTVRIDIDNADLTLRPGQAVDATIHASGSAHVAVSVPASAVTYVDGKPTVFVAETPTRFAARSVEVGLEGGDRVEIVGGVHEGEPVVSKSVLALKSELYR